MNVQQAYNVSLRDVTNYLIDNRIPPEWVDHAYVYGVRFIKVHYSGSVIQQDLLDLVDNERLARLHAYGVPAPIVVWDGWRHPSEAEVAHLHQTHCPCQAAETYVSTHTINLPAYMELDSPPAPIAVASLSGNPLAEPASMDSEMSANADPAPLMMEQENDHSMGTTTMITPATAAPAIGMDTAEVAPE